MGVDAAIEERAGADVAPRDWRSFSTEEVPELVRAAVACFVEQGYHGSTIRQIAARTGLSVPGLYHHYPSKQDLLVAVMEYAMEGLWWRSRAAAAQAGPGPVEQLEAQVECLVLYHATRQELAFLAWSEIRSLEPGARAEHLARRDRQQRVIDEILERGVADGAFATRWPRDTSRALITMCTGVAHWYRRGGPLTPETVSQRYVELAKGLVGLATPGTPRPQDGDEATRQGGVRPPA